MSLRPAAWVAVVALLAGCCSPPFGPEEVAPDAPSEGGVGPRTLSLTVLGPDDPVDDGPLFVFWPDPSRARTLMLLGLRSEDGRAVAHVPDGVGLGVVAGGGLRTVEWVPDAVPAGTGPATAVVRVYPTQVEGTLAGTWSPGAASVHQRASGTPLAWDLHDVRPGASNFTQEGFADRFVGMWANLTWENTLTAQADLGIAAWSDRGSGARCTFSSQTDELGRTGPFVEAYNSSGHDAAAAPDSTPCGISSPVGDLHLPRGPHALLVGPGTEQPAAMPFGLPYRIEYTLAFGYTDSIQDYCERLEAYSTLVYLDPETGEPMRSVAIGESNDAPLPAALPLLPLLALAGAALLRRVDGGRAASRRR